LTRGIKARPTEAFLKNQSPLVGGAPGRVPGARPWNRFPIFNSHASNKLSMTVDLLQPRGMDVFRRLVQISDVFVENNVTATMDRLGISYDMLKEQKQDIIVLRMPAYGLNGPYQAYRALGVHIEGVIGHSLLRGYTDMDPSANTGVYMADAAAGAQGAFAALAALHYRRRTGLGQLIELSQAENAIPYLGQAFMDYSMNGRSAGTTGNRHAHAVQGCYPCRGDDRWVCITIFDDADWQAFCGVLGDPEWSRDERFTDPLDRFRHHDEIDQHIGRWTSGLDHYRVMRLLQAAGVAAGPVMDQRDAYGDPHLNERGMFHEVHQEDTGAHLYPGPPYKLSGTSMGIRRGPVRLGEDNEYVYKTLLKTTDAEYAELEEAGHIGMDYSEDIP
jgi:crotonobetainyl-CoA:carnitine CoA-transferase CaiB-like acyl-CoA transferase